MKIKTLRQQLIKSVAIGICATIIMLFFMLSVISVVENRDYQRERLRVLEKFLRFQTNAEITINESIHLLEGYLAYIETNPNISQEESEEFIIRLLHKKETLIRNIGIIKDTTIIWNFPREGNEKAIGLNLANVESQKYDVLKVKNSLERIFIGPIDLFQGGTGFIARIPIIHDGEYWGQISIVLDGLKYLDYINSIADESNLNIVVFKKDDFPNVPIYGDKSIVDRDGLVLDIEILDSKWEIATEPIGGWENTSTYGFVLRIVAIFSSIFTGILLYMTIYTKGQLKHQAFKDYLTKLNNRHALSYFYNKINKSIKLDNASIYVIMFDINNFKKINDTYGHDVGDLVLIEFANKLNLMHIKSKNIFRLGGDEFLILARDLNKEYSFEINVENIRKEIAFEFDNNSMCFNVIPSVGIAEFPKDGDTLEKVIVTADKRMYEDKEANRIKIV